MNQEQVRQTLGYIENNLDENEVRNIFSFLGQSCYQSRHLHTWIDSYGHDIQKMIDWIASNNSPFWEKLEYSGDRKSLLLTGKTVTRCACAFYDAARPQKALCNYCCKKFQETLWGDLLNKKVEVDITAAFILGDDRCNTTIHVLE